MARVSQGDAQAFQQLVDAGIDRVLAVARRILGDEMEAEDIAQDVFLKLWRRAGQWEAGRARVSTWLYRVTVNSCIDRLRARKEQMVDELPEIGGSATQLKTLEEGDLREFMDDALQALPERQRVALVLFHYENLSMSSVAETMDASVEAVESLLARGRRTLKKSLDPHWRAILPEVLD
ncbi:ECF RNA polymerase sigma factor SigW [bacterium BMS3Bbin10]|nr:ECF RNA polymerase sigma factor SigW [bacterium BMS3Bbin10]